MIEIIETYYSLPSAVSPAKRQASVTVRSKNLPHLCVQSFSYYQQAGVGLTPSTSCADIGVLHHLSSALLPWCVQWLSVQSGQVNQHST